MGFIMWWYDGTYSGGPSSDMVGDLEVVCNSRSIWIPRFLSQWRCEVACEVKGMEGGIERIGLFVVVVY